MCAKFHCLNSTVTLFSEGGGVQSIESLRACLHGDRVTLLLGSVCCPNKENALKHP